MQVLTLIMVLACCEAAFAVSRTLPHMEPKLPFDCMV